MIIIVGNFILDFNYEMMSKCLRVQTRNSTTRFSRPCRITSATMLRETGLMPDTVNWAMRWSNAMNPSSAR